MNGVGATLRQILQEAVRYDIITKNPAEHAKRPKKDTEEVIPLTTPEITRMQLLLDGSKPRPSLAGFYLALFAGLRRGEICGLRWCDVDLEGDTPELTVRHSLDSKNMRAERTENTRFEKNHIPFSRVSRLPASMEEPPSMQAA